jgi:glycosyltransferase involved in cell wall biosynthesis
MANPWDALRNCIGALRADPISALYRLELPLRAMVQRSWCSATLYDAAASQFSFSSGNPFLTQRFNSLTPATRDLLRAAGCAIVHDLDDLLWAIPSRNVNAALVTADLLAGMDAWLRGADLVTASTEPLAAALERRGIAAVIVPNLLDPLDWQIAPPRAPRTRLRVGWYGQRSVHVDDLAIIASIVDTLGREVDFVFYGDVPSGLTAAAATPESHRPTAIELFPAMLAALDLDLLLAPLAHGEFNECKSNLRLLQAGMLGYAVIATDIEPHRTLPVALVDNAPAAWIRAIRERIGERAAVAAEGRSLQAAVRARFTLDDAWTERIFTTWTGRAPETTA